MQYSTHFAGCPFLLVKFDLQMYLNRVITPFSFIYMSSSKLPDVGTAAPNDRSCAAPDYLSDRLLDAMQTSVIFFDAAGVVLRTNTQALEDLHADTPPLGRRLADIISVVYGNKDILPGLLAEFDNPATELVKLPPNVFMRCNDGRARFFVAGCVTRLDCGNFLLSFRNVVDELTQEYMLKMALSSTKIFPWFYDFERGAMVIDPRYFEYTGIESPDCTMTLEEYAAHVHPDDLPSVSHALSLQLNGEHYPYPVSFRLLRGDGRYEWFEAQSTYLGQVEGMPYRVVGICMSTQAHKDIEDALTTAKDKAEQSDRLKSAFLANMSHEIRTPLNAIVGFSNLLAGGEVPADSEEGREYVELINRNCDYLLTLVSDILDLSRIETDTMEYSFELRPLGQLLSDIYQKYKYTYAFPEGVAFNLLLPEKEIRIETDPMRLRQAVENLLNNALKFTAQGHIDLGCKLSSDGRSVRLFVADTGRGIPEDQADRIFDRFYKIDSFVQGAGLGLSICKTIAERLGGTIAVSSRPNEGACFTLRLPLRQQSRARSVF